jgi:hypothetical protein
MLDSSESMLRSINEEEAVDASRWGCRTRIGAVPDAIMQMTNSATSAMHPVKRRRRRRSGFDDPAEAAADPIPIPVPVPNPNAAMTVRPHLRMTALAE